MPEEQFLNFRKLISASLIKGLYLAGAGLIVSTSVLWASYPFVNHYTANSAEPYTPADGLHIIGAVALFTVGNLLWRLLCEAWILLFSVHEILASIEKNIKTQVGLAEELARVVVSAETNTEQRHQELFSLLSRIQAPASSKWSE